MAIDTTQSTSQLLAQRAIQKRLADQQAQLAEPTYTGPNIVNSPIGLISAGTASIGKTFMAPEQRAAEQANLERANQIRIEQLAYDRSRQAGQDARADRKLAIAEAASGRLQGKADKEKALEVNTRLFDDALTKALDPTRATLETNKGILAQAEANPNISVIADPTSKEIRLVGTNDDGIFEALDLTKQLKATTTIGNKESYRRNLEALRTASLADKDITNDITYDQINQQTERYVSEVGKLNDLDSNQQDRLKGTLDSINQEHQKALVSAGFTKRTAGNEVLTDLERFDAQAAESGERFDAMADFISRQPTETKNDADAVGQIQSDVAQAMSEAREVLGATWDEGYGQLALQRALRETPVEADWYDIAGNIDEEGLREAVTAQMKSINDAKSKYLKKREIDTKYGNRIAGETLKAVGYGTGHVRDR